MCATRRVTSWCSVVALDHGLVQQLFHSEIYYNTDSGLNYSTDN